VIDRRGAPSRATAIVLAAGLATRFGGNKLAAGLDGRPVLQHVLDALAAAGIEDPVVVLGRDAELLEATIAWRAARPIRNAHPELGLSRSLQLGWDAAMSATPQPDVAVVALGDQPYLDPGVVLELLAEPLDSARPVVTARHADGSRNPVRLEPAAAGLVLGASGDRGLGPLLDGRPDLVREHLVSGENPDVDEPSDLVRMVAADWASRVRANAEQVERFRAAPEGADFYAPVTRMFVADPGRQADPVLAAIVAIAHPDDTWLDIGAGAGRYALPLGRVVREVIAVDPSESMLGALREGAGAAALANIRALPGRWPPDSALRAAIGSDPVADVSLIAHVGYDVEAIVPFVEAMENASRRHCVAVLMVESPAAIAAPFWPIVHGEERVGLPALPQFLELLAARRAGHGVEMVAGEGRRWANRDELLGFLRRQLWTVPGTSADRRLEDALGAMTSGTADGAVELRDSVARDIGIVRWPVASGSSSHPDRSKFR